MKKLRDTVSTMSSDISGMRGQAIQYQAETNAKIQRATTEYEDAVKQGEAKQKYWEELLSAKSGPNLDAVKAEHTAISLERAKRSSVEAEATIHLGNVNKETMMFHQAEQRANALEKQCQSHYAQLQHCLLYTSPSPRDGLLSRMPSSA